MKAIILREHGSVDNFELADIPTPTIQKGQIRIRIKAVSFNPVDYQIRKGLPESSSVISNILGKDLSGIVDEVAEDVNDFKKGDEVFCYSGNLGNTGTYTEYICVPSEIVAKKPGCLSYAEAASVPVAGITAMLALIKTKVDKTKSVFIAGGAGGVGSFAIMFARQLGVRKLMTTAGNNKSLSYLIQSLHLKEEQVMNYKDEDFINKTIERNNGVFDITLDLVGGKMLSACCDLVAIDGNFASVTDPPGKDDFEKLFQKNASFHSIGANAYLQSDDPEHWKKYKYILNNISTLFESNAIDKPSITIVGSLSVETVRKAHELLENNSVQGKLVMTC